MNKIRNPLLLAVLALCAFTLLGLASVTYSAVEKSRAAQLQQN